MVLRALTTPSLHLLKARSQHLPMLKCIAGCGPLPSLIRIALNMIQPWSTMEKTVIALTIFSGGVPLSNKSMMWSPRDTLTNFSWAKIPQSLPTGKLAQERPIQCSALWPANQNLAWSLAPLRKYFGETWDQAQYLAQCFKFTMKNWWICSTPWPTQFQISNSKSTMSASIWKVCKKF